jgi:CBS domain-containing protein
VAQLENMPRQRGAEAVVAIVGPLVSLALAGVFYLILRAVPGLPLAVRYVLLYLMVMNVVLAVFNLLPALPLDGGRVLRSLLALRMDPLRATQVAGAVSKFIALALALWAIYPLKPMLLLIAFFIYMAVNAETQQSMIEYMLRGIRVRELMNRGVVTVPPDATVGDVLSLMMREHHLGFPVVEDGRLLGMIDLKQVQGVPPEAPVAQVMSRRLSMIDQDAPALEAFTKMGRTGFGRLIAVDREGRMVGIITKTDLMRAIQVRLAASAPRDASDLREPFERDEELEPVRNLP